MTTPRDSLMWNFRSPVLAEMPSLDTPDRARRLARRRKGAMVAAILIGLPIYLVAARILPKEGPGYWLYWIHDNIFLQAKGYMYTLYYPNSLIWWGVIVTVLVIWLIPFLLDKAPIRTIHIALLRLAVHRKRCHSALVTGAQLLQYLRIKPGLLKAVVERERSLALGNLIASKRGGLTQCTAVAHLTQLLIRLLLPRPSSEAGLDVLVLWHQAFLWIRTYGDRQTGWFGGLVADMVKSLPAITRPILDERDDDRLRQALAQPGSFTPVSLVVSLLYLACLTQSDLAERLLGAKTAARPAREQQELIESHLAAAVAARRLRLEQARSWLEGTILSSRLHLAEANLAALAQAMPAEPANLPALGQLSLTIALDLAALANAPELAWGYLDSIEALTVTLAWIEPNNRADKLAQTLARLMKNLPRPEDYALCAKLAEPWFEDRKKEWADSALKGLLKPGDFELAKTHLAALYQAAGPEWERSPNAKETK